MKFNVGDIVEGRYPGYPEDLPPNRRGVLSLNDPSGVWKYRVTDDEGFVYLFNGDELTLIEAATKPPEISDNMREVLERLDAEIKDTENKLTSLKALRDGLLELAAK